ncbi:hypothetical protein J4771_00915 [Candidatus Kaistella beijingensis]|uniref:hypothetical protein n=1 Tax=Candidatus Kaistella beijingensis TaxID=2820270 RepID=UPI001CC71315|nr:hypothetical protein [Candidatus Kaistella beijingensis]UBB89944.1 hypothetical protein J4771_00915 [Candidatus Kaistella beijingensis]
MNDNLKFSVKVNTSNNYWMAFVLIFFLLFISSFSFANSNKSLSNNKNATFHDKTWNNSGPHSKGTLFIENPNLITGWGNIVISDKVNKTVKKEKTPQKQISNEVIFFNDSIVIRGLEKIYVITDKKSIEKRKSTLSEENKTYARNKKVGAEKQKKKIVEDQKTFKKQTSESSVFYNENQKQNSIVNTISISYYGLIHKSSYSNASAYIYSNNFQEILLFRELSFLKNKKGRAPPFFHIDFQYAA